MNGTNGGGKTTSLKLIPFFYGAEPSQLNPKVENKENFLDFYLPRTTSLIIFEYLREGGHNCAVAYRHSSGTKPAYCFLNHGYTTEAFSVAHNNSKNKFCSSDQLAMHWKSLDLDFSHQLDIVLDYRGIIQNDKRLLSR